MMLLPRSVAIVFLLAAVSIASCRAERRIVNGRALEAAPTGAPSVEAAPSPSLGPTASPLQAALSVTLQSSQEMDASNIEVFESVARDFINDNLPEDEKEVVLVTLVTVTEQVQVERRLRGSQSNSRMLQTPSLLVEMLVQGVLTGDPPANFSFPQSVLNTFEEEPEEFLLALSQASSFFGSSFQAVTEPETATTQDDSLGPGIIVGVAFGLCALAVAAGGFVVKRKKPRTRLVTNGQLSTIQEESHQTDSDSPEVESKATKSMKASSVVVPPPSTLDSLPVSSLVVSPGSKSSGVRWIKSDLSESVNSESESEASKSYVNSKSYSSEFTDYTETSSISGASSAEGLVGFGDKYLVLGLFKTLSPIQEIAERTDLEKPPRTPRTPKKTFRSPPSTPGTPRTNKFVQIMPFCGMGTDDPRLTPRTSRMEECDLRSPKVAFVQNQETPVGTQFVQLDTNSAAKTGGILDDLSILESEWDGKLDSKVNAVAETPRTSNLEKFRKAPKKTLYTDK